MTRPLGVAALVLAVLVSAAHAEPVQITIAPPAEAATMESIQAVTPTTVRIVTKKPDPLLLVRLAQMGAQILPARLTTDEGVKELARRPVGTGAYRFVEWVKDERLVMEANRDWWGWEGRPPAIDRVVWKPIPDDFPRIVALEKGEADIITNVPPDRLKALAEGQSTRSSRPPRHAPSPSGSTPPSRRSPTRACARRFTWRSTSTASSRACTPGWEGP